MGITMKKRYGNELHPLYSRWLSMNQRCNNSNHTSYKDWGGRGIKICKSFTDFTVYVNTVENLPNYSLSNTLDRIDNDGDYTPTNLRWTCRSTQTSNQRPNTRGYNTYTGVNFNKVHNRWIARINFKGKTIFSKVCKTEEEALNTRNTYITLHQLPHPLQLYCQ